MATYKYSYNRMKPVEQEKDKILRQLEKHDPRLICESWEVKDGYLYITYKDAEQ